MQFRAAIISYIVIYFHSTLLCCVILNTFTLFYFIYLLFFVYYCCAFRFYLTFIFITFLDRAKIKKKKHYLFSTLRFFPLMLKLFFSNKIFQHFGWVHVMLCYVMLCVMCYVNILCYAHSVKFLCVFVVCLFRHKGVKTPVVFGAETFQPEGRLPVAAFLSASGSR